MKFFPFSKLSGFGPQLGVFILFALYLSSLVLAQPFTSVVLAEALPNSEVKALNNYAQWVADQCSVGRPSVTDFSGGGGPVYMIGDSITAGAKADLEAEFRGQLLDVAKIDGVPSRSFTSKGEGDTNGLQQLDADRQVIKRANSVVIAVGTNGEDAPGESKNFKKNAEAALRKVQGTGTNAKIYWVNLFSGNPPVRQKDEYNKVINGLSGVEVIDANKANISLADKIHPDGAGYKKYAKTVVAAIKSDTGTKSDGSNKANGLRLDQIAQQSNIQSIAVRRLGTDQIKYYNATNPPNAVASTLKLILVDTAIVTGVKLSERVKIDGEVYYGSDDAIKKNDTVTIREAVTEALGSKSSNNGANAIIKALGGPDEAADKINKAGYKDTTFTSYFKDTSSSDVKNNSTAEEVTKAMNSLYSGDNDSYKVAQSALQESSKNDGGGYGLKSEANKWGLRNTPPARGNSAVFKIGDAKYIITMYTNQAKEDNITKATNKIVNYLETSPDESTNIPSVNQQCCLAGKSTVLNGNGNEEKIWNYFIQELGLNDIQAAAIMGNMEQESSFDPKIVNPRSGAYGIAQWLGNRKTNLENLAQSKGKPVSDLGLQLDFLKSELQGGYKTTVLEPIKASNNIAQATRIWLERFEIPCTPGPDCDPEMQIRLPNAIKWLKKFGGGAANPGATDNSSQGGNCGSDSGSGGFSPIKYSSKNELIERALASKNIVWGNYGSADDQKKDVKSCLTENTLVGLVTMAEKSGVKLPINSMATDHGGCTGGGGSLHNAGRAIDIGYFGNGNSRNTPDGNKLYSYLYNNRKELKIDELIWQDPPSGQNCVKNLEPAGCYTTYAGVIDIHYHHIHVGFK